MSYESMFDGTSLERASWPKSIRQGICFSPIGSHLPSDDARRAGVSQTRCLACRQRIFTPDDECGAHNWHTHLDK